MGDIACQIEFDKFKWDRSGYISVMNSSGIQKQCLNHAESVRAAADAMGKRWGYRRAYKTKHVVGKMVNGYIACTSGADGWYDNLKNNTLKKASGF